MLGHTAILCSPSWGTGKLFFTAAAPFRLPTSRVACIYLMSKYIGVQKKMKICWSKTLLWRRPHPYSMGLGTPGLCPFPHSKSRTFRPLSVSNCIGVSGSVAMSGC